MGCSLSTILDSKENVSNCSSLSRNKFLYARTIGEGGFGRVTAEVFIEDQKWYALKEIKKTTLLKHKTGISMLFGELQALSRADHTFLVKLHFAFHDKNACYLGFDLKSGGDLRFYLRHKHAFEEKTIAFMACCITAALNYLHRKKIIHRDVKPENIILDSHGWPHLTDFGVAYVQPQDSPPGLPLTCPLASGTKQYLAPEVFTKGHHHGPESDFWSLGVVIYELLFFRRPFDKHVPVSYIQYVELSNKQKCSAKSRTQGYGASNSGGYASGSVTPKKKQLPSPLSRTNDNYNAMSFAVVSGMQNGTYTGSSCRQSCGTPNNMSPNPKHTACSGKQAPLSPSGIVLKQQSYQPNHCSVVEEKELALIHPTTPYTPAESSASSTKLQAMNTYSIPSPIPFCNSPNGQSINNSISQIVNAPNYSHVSNAANKMKINDSPSNSPAKQFVFPSRADGIARPASATSTKGRDRSGSASSPCSNYPNPENLSFPKLAVDVPGTGSGIASPAHGNIKGNVSVSLFQEEDSQTAALEERLSGFSPSPKSFLDLPSHLRVSIPVYNALLMKVSSSCIDIIEGLLEVRPHCRLGAGNEYQVKNMRHHEWFRRHDWNINRLECRSLGGKGGGGFKPVQFSNGQMLADAPPMPPFNPNMWRGDLEEGEVYRDSRGDEILGGPVICPTTKLVMEQNQHNQQNIEIPSTLPKSLTPNRRKVIEKDREFSIITSEQQYLFEGFNYRYKFN